LWVLGYAGVELREQGCVKFSKSATWSELGSYRWESRNGTTATLDILPASGPLLPSTGTRFPFARVRVPVARKTEIEAILNARLGKTSELATSAATA
jgi:hypothetical protein